MVSGKCIFYISNCVGNLYNRAMNTCTKCKIGFEVTEADKAFYSNRNVPAPTHCHSCRQQRRIAWRNDQNYYHNKCQICEKSLISIYSPDKNISVLCRECFWSDKFDPLQYGTDFDFNKTFSEQFKQLQEKTPRIAIYNTQSENSEYTIHSARNRNCYMGSSLIDNEDIFYSDWVMNSKDCMDSLFCTQMERCYQCIDSQECYNSDYLKICVSLSDSFLCFDCRNGENLIGCIGLRNKQNYILNQKSTKEECEQTKQKLQTDPDFFKIFKKKYEELCLKLPKRDKWIINSENCHGNHIFNSKNVLLGFNCRNIEDGKYIFESIDSKDVYDITRTVGEFLYDCQGIVDLQYSMFCNLTYHSGNMIYCDNCQNCNFCFGSISLKRNKYCILNKQYTKEEYEQMVPRIIEHMKKTQEWGEFFPIGISPFGYNETKAQEFFPLTKEECLAEGYKWCEFEAELPKVAKTINASQIPPNVKDVPDDILDWAITCEESNKPFKIISQELEFYRSKNLPIPHISPQERHKKRMATKKDRTIYERKCARCDTGIKTTYPPDGPEIVYCEKCYLEEVY